MIGTDRLCPNCMNDNGGEKICPVCGYDNNQTHNDADKLPERFWISDKYMVGSLSELKSGSYYIQIAALSNDDNAVVHLFVFH